MKISPVSFGQQAIPKGGQLKSKINQNSDYIPTTSRKNSLADMEFNIIADTIRCQNLKNQMSVRLANLKRNLDSCMAKDTYS